MRDRSGAIRAQFTKQFDCASRLVLGKARLQVAGRNHYLWKCGAENTPEHLNALSRAYSFHELMLQQAGGTARVRKGDGRVHKMNTNARGLPTAAFCNPGLVFK